MENLTGNAVANIADLVRASLQQPTETVVDFEKLTEAQFYYKTHATDHGRELSDMLTPPQPGTIEVTTLTGLVDFLKASDLDATKHMIHVADQWNVFVRALETDRYGRRATLLKAKYTPLDAFKFDEYYQDPQRFIIGLQIAFDQTEESLYLIRLASSLKAGDSVQTNDDGFSQRVTVQTGEVSTAEVKVKPRIKLLPIRCFHEVPRVETEYLIRFKTGPQGQAMPGLFDLDQNKWKTEAMQAIKGTIGKLLGDGHGYSILA
jgi:hypothetical protein